MEDLFEAPILPRSFYERDTVLVARQLLDKVIVHGKTAGRITETEAYLGEADLAAHSSRGRTPSTEVIFGPPGFAYVYLIYGMYHCLNFVAETDGTAGCVLIRALEPLAGLDTMQQRRGASVKHHQLTNGPGKLTLALGINKQQNGSDVTAGTLIARDWRTPNFKIITSQRIGITKSVHLPLRFNMLF